MLPGKGDEALCGRGVVWQRRARGRSEVTGGIWACSRRGQGAGCRVWRSVVEARRGWDAHGIPEGLELLLEHLVAAQQFLDGLVAGVHGAQLLELCLETLNVILGTGADGALGLSVVSSLAGELGSCESRDAAGAFWEACQQKEAG